MKHYFLILFIILFSCCKNESSDNKKIKGSDKEIALTIAEKTWKEAYGKSAINQQKPFVAEKKNDSIWIVHGTFPKPTIGGVAYAEINVKTQEVVTYTHGE
jgi:hypothetical protein